MALVTQPAFAKALGLTVSTFHRWRDAGRIPEPLPLPGHPRWSDKVVAATKREIEDSGEGRYFRTARRQQRPLQSSLSRPVDGQRPRKASDLSRQSVSDLHAGSVSAAEQPAQVHSVEGSR